MTTRNLSQSVIALTPSDDFTAIVSAAPAGTRFILAPGVYRHWSARPKDGQQFIGSGDSTILDGSRVLTNWQRDAQGRYYVNGQTQQGGITNIPGACLGTHPRCQYPHDVFFNGAPLYHRDTLAGLGPGEYHFDYNAARIYLYDNPAGALVVTSVTSYAFNGVAHDVVIRDLYVRYYATPLQQGTVQMVTGGTNWVISHVRAEWNHATAFNLSDGALIEWCIANHNGQKGLGAGGNLGGSGITVRYNEIAHNNYAGVADNWDAGATKFSSSDGVLFEYNWVHHNNGKGVWFDINNVNSTVRHNWIHSNASNGLYYEISHGGHVAHDNKIKLNGYAGCNNTLYYSQLQIHNSGPVHVYDNLFVVGTCGNGAMIQHLSYTSWPTTPGNVIENNTFVFLDAASGRVGFNPAVDQAAFYTWGNRFAGNTYYVPAASQARWRYSGGSGSFAQWQSSGQDTAGRLLVGAPDDAAFIPNSFPFGEGAVMAYQQNFNFQLGGAPVPSGYTEEDGSAYAADPGWGWVAEGTTTPKDMTSAARDRNRVGIAQELDTIIHMDRHVAGVPSAPGPGSWQVDVPNGNYSITVSVGDQPDETAGYDSVHRINVNGVNAIDDFQATAEDEYHQATIEITVTTGRITVDSVDGTNTKINYVLIAQIPGAAAQPNTGGMISAIRRSVQRRRRRATEASQRLLDMTQEDE